MKRLVFLVAAVALAAALGGNPEPAAAQPVLPSVVPACPGPAPAGAARCHAQRRTDRAPRPAASGPGAGYGPQDLWAAYNLPSSYNPSATPNGPIVAIVDAYDAPTAEADLTVYRAQYGLPPCTTANGCFRKSNQRGGTTYPAANSGWAQEIALDLDMVSAVCPMCRILLVEADSNSLANLGAAVNYAATQGVVAISNSYGAREFLGETSYEGPYNHTGIAVTVSSGDGGYGVEFPAASRYVTAVGGTSLKRSSTATRGWTESVWSGAGSGCSSYVPKPSWQTDSGCARRTVADVAAVADPYTGVNVYDSYASGGWTIFGGTSVASPIIASVYGLAQTSGGVNAASYLYSHAGATNFYDVISGSNGHCKTKYLCTGVGGYDGPTGLGTPHGTGGF